MPETPRLLRLPSCLKTLTTGRPGDGFGQPGLPRGVPPPRLRLSNVADNEPANRKLLETWLAEAGFTCVAVADGMAALRTLQAFRFDAVLLDIKMPLLDGEQLARRLKADPATRAIPVVFLTGLADTEQKLRAFQAGGVDYITKPFDAREVLARVVLHLDQHRLRRHLQHRLEAYEQAARPSAERSLGLQRVADYMLEHLAEDPSLDELARLAYSNHTSLDRDVQRAYGKAPFEWLREQRLLRAAELLRGTALPLAAVAQPVGYAGNSFTTTFRQRFGVAPRDYRATSPPI